MIFVLAFFSAALAQEVVKKKAPMIDDRNLESSSINVILSGDNPVTAANYVPVDTMANSFGPASNTLNPMAFDPISGVLAIVHRGYSAYALGSGELWWNWSTDFGANWTRSETSVQNGQTATIVGRYPSMAIFNPLASSNMADVLGVFSWPELNPAAFGYLGYGVSEGMLQSSFADIITGTPPNDYSSNVPTFTDDQYSYWTSDFYNGGNGGNAALRLFRTADFSTVDIIDPPTWASSRFGDNGNIQAGGVSHNGSVYVGVVGSFTELYSPNGWELGYSKSTDHGTTWSDWNVVNFSAIPALNGYQMLWDWKTGDTFVSYSSDIQVDANGLVHFVTGVSDTLETQFAIVEIFETSTNVWDAKIVSTVHNLSYYGYNDDSPGLGQTGPSIMIAANEDRDFFAVQYTLGSPETADTLCDIYYHTRALGDANWSGATNLTETNNMNEDGCHIAPYMATSGGTDYIFSGFWYERGNTGPTINQTNPAVFFVAPVAVRSAGGDIPVTFQVDMGVQEFEGNFPAGANVVVRGDFQMAFGDTVNWGGNTFQLSDPNDDNIYTGTFNAPNSLAGNSYNFKYVIVNPPANDNWEFDPTRQLTVSAPSTIIPVDCFNRDCDSTVIINVTNTINFTADISAILGIGAGGAFDPNTDSLLVMGLDWDNLGKNVVGNRRLLNTDINPGIYTTTLTVTNGSAAPIGVGDSTKWKFHAYPESRFGNSGWETGSDRWHIYQANGTTVTLPVIVPRILPNLPALTADQPIQITVNLTGAVNRYNGLAIPLNELQFVGMRGGADFLGNWFTGGTWSVSDTTTGLMKVLTNLGNNIWRINVVAPSGQAGGVYELKFAAMYPGADTIHGGSTPLDNEGGFGVNHTFILSANDASRTLFYQWGDFTPGVIQDVEDSEIPMTYNLAQNYPNPFNPSTKIKFSIPEAGIVTLKVFNLLGEEVATLLNAEKTAGNYEATFDASNLSSGIYFYKLEAQNFTSTKKMLLLK